jgi:hypothetical protein
MRFKRIVIHIGAEKTGSTTIQNFLFLNRYILKDAGIYFAQSPGKKNHSMIPKLLTSAVNNVEQGKVNDFREKKIIEIKTKILKEIYSEAVGCHTLIISSEHFHSKIKTQQEISRLKEILPDSDKVEILFYIRRQDRVCLSLYSTKVGAGSTKDFKFPSVNRNRLPYRYDYNAAYELWSNSFGVGSVKVNIFDNIVQHKNGLLKHLCAYLGINEDSHTITGEVENRSLDVNGLYLMKMVNRMGIGRTEFIKIRRIILSNFTQGEKFRPLKDEAVNFQQKFHFSNAELSRKILNHPLEDIFDNNYEYYIDKDLGVGQDKNFDLIIKNILEVLLKFIQQTK